MKEGQIRYFYSREDKLSLDHIVASGSLPPAFPATVIEHKPYWDGGLFDNTPLGAIIERLDSAAGVNRTIYVVNLFPNKAPIPQNLLEIEQRMKNLQFANKTSEDLKLLRQIALRRAPSTASLNGGSEIVHARSRYRALAALDLGKLAHRLPPAAVQIVLDRFA